MSGALVSLVAKGVQDVYLMNNDSESSFFKSKYTRYTNFAQAPKQLDFTGVIQNNGSTLPKTFVIDHPVDSSRYLVHACLEGPESGVYYRGKGTISLESATVTLPDYTRDFYNFSISITPIGKPRTFSVSEFENGKFEVFSTPGDFFWVIKK